MDVRPRREQQVATPRNLVVIFKMQCAASTGNELQLLADVSSVIVASATALTDKKMELSVRKDNAERCANELREVLPLLICHNHPSVYLKRRHGDPPILFMWIDVNATCKPKFSESLLDLQIALPDVPLLFASQSLAARQAIAMDKYQLSGKLSNEEVERKGLSETMHMANARGVFRYLAQDGHTWNRLDKLLTMDVMRGMVHSAKPVVEKMPNIWPKLRDSSDSTFGPGSVYAQHYQHAATRDHVPVHYKGLVPLDRYSYLDVTRKLKLIYMFQRWTIGCQATCAPMNRFWNAFAVLNQFAPPSNDIKRLFDTMYATYEVYFRSSPRQMLLQDLYDWLERFVKPELRKPAVLLDLLAHVHHNIFGMP